MNDPAAETLLRPFDTGAVDWPAGPLLFLNARPVPSGRGALENPARVMAVQPERGLFLALGRAGFDARPQLPPEARAGGFAAVFILAARQRAENEAMLAQASRLCAAGGLIVMAGDKTSGVEAMARMLAKAGATPEKLSKNHCVVFWSRAPLPSMAQHVTASAAEAETPVGGFSVGAVDEGSRLLVETLPEGVAGTVADLGAGWGYLAREVALRRPKVSALTLVESRFESLEAARANCAGLSVPASFHWLDATAEKLPTLHDWVVMNPPFHDALGRHAPELGQAFIRAAHAMLKPGGRLVMVANRQLPYEVSLAQSFRTVEKLAETGRFKVMLARR